MAPSKIVEHLATLDASAGVRVDSPGDRIDVWRKFALANGAECKEISEAINTLSDRASRVYWAQYQAISATL